MNAEVIRRNSISYKYKSYKDGKVTSSRSISIITKWWHHSKMPSHVEEIKNDWNLTILIIVSSFYLLFMDGIEYEHTHNKGITEKYYRSSLQLLESVDCLTSCECFLMWLLSRRMRFISNFFLTYYPQSRFLSTLSATRGSKFVLPSWLVPFLAWSFDLLKCELSLLVIRCSFFIFSKPIWPVNTFFW